MNETVLRLTLPASVADTASRLAFEDGVSLDQWVANALAQKIAAAQSAAEFFRERSAGARPGDLARILELVPANPPDPGDELPEGWR